MSGNYLVCYTMFNPYFSHGFKSFYRHFEKIEDVEKFIKIKGIENNCIIYKKIDR